MKIYGKPIILPPDAGKLVRGTFNTSETVYEYTLQHNLGEIPNFAAFFIPVAGAGYTYSLIYAIQFEGEYAIYGVSSGETSGTTIEQRQGHSLSLQDQVFDPHNPTPFTAANETTIKINAGTDGITKWATYYWIVAKV